MKTLVLDKEKISNADYGWQRKMRVLSFYSRVNPLENVNFKKMQLSSELIIIIFNWLSRLSELVQYIPHVIR